MRRVLVPQAVDPRSLARRDPSRPVLTLSGETMGTSWSAKLVTEPELLNDLKVGIVRTFDRIIAQMSTWVETSDVCRFNHSKPGSWHPLADDFFTVLDCALRIAAESGGAFDPTAGPLVNLWGFGPQAHRAAPPSSEEVAEVWKRCGWDRIHLDREVQCAFQAGGVELDFSAIGKGFAVDRAADYLLASGVSDFLVEVGGELRGEGVKPDGNPWWAAIETPGQLESEPETLVALHGLSIATSGDYVRFFEVEDQRYAHSIDPRTGRPIENGVISATVLHSSCMEADAYSTALTVLGPEQGMAFADGRSLPALIRFRTNQGVSELASPAFMAMIE